MSLIGLWHNNNWKYGTMIIIAMMVNLLNGTMVIKNEKPKKPQQKKNSCPLSGIPIIPNR